MSNQPTCLYYDKTDPASRAQNMRNSAELADAYGGVYHSKADFGDFGGRTFVNVENNISVKSDFQKNDYDYFRRGEHVPERQYDIIKMCMRAYDKVSIVKRVVDLMGDFSSQGIKLVHPNRKIEDFYQTWFKKVEGKDRSERFLNMLYRAGNVIIWRADGKITTKIENEWRANAGDETITQDNGIFSGEVEIKKVVSKHYVLPLKYTIFNPLAIEVMGGNLAVFLGKPVYALRLVDSLRGDFATDYDRIPSAYSLENNKLADNIPDYILKAFKEGNKFLPLDQEKVSAYFYKKDDWRVWANPMIYAILDDLVQLKKLELADRAALDGAISNIRLWSLGSLDHQINPTRAGVNKLRDILANNVGGGVLDLVWGPELTFKESNSQVHRFLGSEKYQVVLSKIYTGLGIPPSLTGVGGDGGFTNNYMAIKTLIEQLQYGRDVLTKFWEKEIKRVQLAMGFKYRAQISFDQMILSDEAAEKALLIQLADRNIISDETLQDKFDLTPDIEKIRVKRQETERKTTKMSPKASPFHNPQTKDDLTKMALQGGDVTHSQVGLDLPPAQPGEQTPNDLKNQRDIETAKLGHQNKIEQIKYKPKNNTNGRPKNKKDSGKRKQKRVLPRTSANLMLWTTRAQKAISEILSPVMLGVFERKNLRSLSSEEFKQAEYLKFCTLCSLKPYEQVTAELVYIKLANPDLQCLEQTLTIKNSMKVDAETIEDIRQIEVMAYVFLKENEEIKE